MAQGAAGVLVHSSMAPGSQSSLWHFLGSDPEPAAVLEMQELRGTSQSSLSYPQKHDFAKFKKNNVSMILLRQGNVSHSQEMINSLCSSVLASRCTLSTGPYRSYQVLSPAATVTVVTEEIAPRKTRRLCRWHDFTLWCEKVLAQILCKIQ
jgi:hypothetical protein